jgi:hypothetical protein
VNDRDLRQMSNVLLSARGRLVRCGGWSAIMEDGMSFLQIGSWNIEHLSGAPREKRRQSVYALAEHIELASIDIMALQEVYVTHEKDGERRNSDLDEVTELLEEHLDDPWDYMILPNRTPGDKAQLCAVMWNTARVQQSGILKIPVLHKKDGLSLWDRAPHAIRFTMAMKVWHRDETGKWTEEAAAKSVAIIPLHMKSNVGGPTKNRLVRAAEAAELCAHLPQVRAELDESLILIGDTNCLDNREDAITTYVAAGLVDLNNTDGPTHWSVEYGESPFDRAFVAEGRKEFRYTRQYILRSSDLALHDRFLSDHQMIKISVKSYVDDTDPRTSAV